MASGRCNQSTIGPELRPPDLAGQNLNFMAEHQQLDVGTAAATNEQTEQSSDSHV